MEILPRVAADAAEKRFRTPEAVRATTTRAKGSCRYQPRRHQKG